MGMLTSFTPSRRRRAYALLASVLTLSVLACSSSPENTEGALRNTPPPLCQAGALRCADALTPERCDGQAFVRAQGCAVGEVCSGGTCATGSALAQARLEQIRAAMAKAEGIISDPALMDRARIERLAWAELAQGDDDARYVSALRVAFQEIKQGHQALRFGTCEVYAGYSRHGVCLRPSGSNMVVTAVAVNHALGLKPGDVIAGVEKDGASPNLDDYALRIPMCTGSYPNKLSQRHHAALSLAAGFEKGTTLRVTSEGAQRSIEVPSPKGLTLDCNDPFGRSGYEVKATLRDDGIGVIHLRSFYPSDMPQNPTQVEFEQKRDALRARILAAFESVKGARGIVWDLRGNGGGITSIGLDIAAGMPGARAGVATECYLRRRGSDAYDGPSNYYELAPGGPFAVPAGTKVAVIIDGSDYSAADYFPYFVRHATDVKLVGEATAGAFGGARASVRVPDATLPADLALDPISCRATTGERLEGHGVEPHFVVQLDPAALAAGRDNQLEKALELVR
jgi:C-terminal processing protease CtpA/Prc